jgi:hypothetical protein
MSNETSPLHVALAFTEAWTSHDLKTAAGYVADDVVFDGPLGHTTTLKDYLDGITNLAKSVTSARILAAYGDAQQALIMYELATNPFGTLRCAKLLQVRDGRIVSDKLAFDSHLIRKVRDAQK